MPRNSAQESFRGSEIRAQNASEVCLADGSVISAEENLRRIESNRSNGELLAAGDGFSLGRGGVREAGFYVKPDGTRVMVLDATGSGSGGNSEPSQSSRLYANGAGDVRGPFYSSSSASDPFVIESSTFTGNGLKGPSDGFWRGLTGEGRSVFEGPASFGENLGLTVNGLVTGPVRAAYGLASEIGNEYKDAYNLLTRDGASYTPSSVLGNSLQRQGMLGTLGDVSYALGSAPTKPVFDLLNGDYRAFGEGLPGTVAMGMGAARGVGLKLGKTTGSNFIDFTATSDLQPGFYRTNPAQLRNMQPTVSPNFSDGGTINSLAADLRARRITPDQVGDPLRVVMVEGRPFSFDNRRVISYNLAGETNVPIQIMGLDDPVFSARVRDRFNPIRGEGLQVVIVPATQRASVTNDLYNLGLVSKRK